MITDFGYDEGGGEVILGGVMADDKKITDSHCESCHHDHEEGFVPYDEFDPYCCCEQARLHKWGE